VPEGELRDWTQHHRLTLHFEYKARVRLYCGQQVAWQLNCSTLIKCYQFAHCSRFCGNCDARY
jgi:hypothetical protein